YDKFHQAQDTVSRMMRTIEQNAMIASYPRYLVMKSGYDRQSLLNSHRPGAVVEQTAQGSIVPFPFQALPNEVATVINQATSDFRDDLASAAGVDVTGANMSATAAMITANSADLKDKEIARVLANTLFKPLFEGLYEVLRSEDIKIGEMPGQQDPVTGQMTPPTPITGSTLPKSHEFQIDVTTTNDDGILANQLIQLGNTFAQWSQVQSPLLNPQTMIGIAKKVTGLDDQAISEFFIIPQPTEEEIAIQQQNQQSEMESKELGKELLRAQIEAAAAEAAKTEQETIELISNGKAERKRKEEENIIKLETLELKKRELEYEIETGNSIQVSKY
ncbi:MAG: portal protein, partial [Cetobacterium sp.]